MWSRRQKRQPEIAEPFHTLAWESNLACARDTCAEFEQSHVDVMSTYSSFHQCNASTLNSPDRIALRTVPRFTCRPLPINQSIRPDFNCRDTDYKNSAESDERYPLPSLLEGLSRWDSCQVRLSTHGETIDAHGTFNLLHDLCYNTQ